MGSDDKKGWIGGTMKFNVGQDEAPAAESKAPLLPLRVLVVADLVPHDEHNAGASPPDAPIRIDPSRFEELFRKLRPRLAIEVPSVLADGRLVRVDLSPTDLKSFRPDGLCAEVPLLRSLLDGRLVLDRLQSGAIDEATARREIERLFGPCAFAREVVSLLGARAESAPEAPAAKAAPEPARPVAEGAGGGSIDSILSMVALDAGGASNGAPRAAVPAAAPAPAGPAAGASSRFSELIAAVARSARPGSASGPPRPAEAIAKVERALGIQIGAILQHPEVRRLERAFRGLRFLVDRAQAHAGIVFDVVSVRPDEAAQAFERAARLSGSAPPVSFAVIDVEVDGSAASLARLEAIAAAAEAAVVPAVVNGTPRLVGADDLGAVERLDHKAGWIEAPERAPWRSTAAKPAMRWVTVALNGALGRLAYDKGASRVREAVVQETPADEAAIVWLAPAYVVGALVIGSFRATGWPARIVGPRSGGVVENLPVREIDAGGPEGAVAIPTEAFLSTDTQRELAKTGVLALAAAPNSDAIYVLSAPTAYLPPPKRTYDSATTEPEVRFDRVPLGDQLFVARIVQFLRALCSKLPASSPPADVQPVVEGALWELFENAPPAGPEIAVEAKAGEGGTSVVVAIRPRRYVGVTLEELSLEMPLG